MVICLERGANDLHMVQLTPLPAHHFFIKIQIGQIFLLPVYPDFSGKEAIRWLSCLLNY